MSKTKSRPAKNKRKAKWPALVWEEFAEITSVYRFRDFDNDTHKVPNIDVIEHVPSANCPCNPVLDLEAEKKVSITGESIWNHKLLAEFPI